MSCMLVLAEVDGSKVLPATSSSIAFAQKFQAVTGIPFCLLILGRVAVVDEASAWAHFGAQKVFTAADELLASPTANQVSVICKAVMKSCGAQWLVAASTSFARDVLPAAAQALDLPMVTDATGILLDGNSNPLFTRQVYACSFTATVSAGDGGAVLTARAASYRDPEVRKTVSAISAVSDLAVPEPSYRILGRDCAGNLRPELSTARTVVSGGSPLKDAATFEKLIGGLADALGGAVGATRGAVDNGLAPNEIQIGQTGKTVAPDLYIAAGISGSLQHVAGMKDSRVIVAINNDRDAPIFQVADYGLVADLFSALPELQQEL